LTLPLTTEFLLDLSLICDALQELSELLLELERGDMNLYHAHQAISGFTLHSGLRCCTETVVKA